MGPYLVIKRISYLTYRIQKNKESNPIVVHVDQMKPFQGAKHPKNWLREAEAVPDVAGSDPSVSESVPSEMPVQIRSRRGRIVKPRGIYSPD